jgi:hypothetical protein
LGVVHLILLLVGWLKYAAILQRSSNDDLSDELREKAGQPCDATPSLPQQVCLLLCGVSLMSYLSLFTVATIDSFKAGYQLDSDWRTNLRNLADSLAECSGMFWTLDPVAAEHYVYVLCDPRHPGNWTYKLPSGRTVRFPYRPFYVGKGRGRRSSTHGAARNLAAPSHKNNTIKAIRSEGVREIVQHSRDALTTDFLAQAYEVDLIAGIGRKDLGAGPLTNKTDGAEGKVGHIPSAETRAKNGASHRGKKKVVTVPFSSARREAIRLRMLGNKFSVGKNLGPLSEETKAKISAANKGKKRTPEQCAALSLQRRGRRYKKNR